MVLIGRGLRVIAGWLDLAVHTLLLWGLALLPRAWSASWYPALFRGWCRTFVRALRIDLRLHQHQTAQLPSRYLLIANHPSAVEDIGIPALFPVDSLAKAELKDWWIAGRISGHAGTLYVRRDSKASRRQAADAIVAALEKGRCIALYPEGGCKGRRLARCFHYGTFEIAQRADVPVVPVFIHYEAQDAFEWLHESLPRKILSIAVAPNRAANYHVFDPFWPRDYPNAATFHDAVYAQYQRWEQQFL